jgi:hypothetical protein
MAKSKQDKLGQPAECSRCNVVTHQFVCVMTNNPNDLSERRTLCVECEVIEHEKYLNERAAELKRVENLVRNNDWEW